MGNYQEAFTKAVIHYFSKLIKDARCTQRKANISKENLQNQVADIHDVDTTTADSKRGPKLQAHRWVTTNSYKRLHQDFQKLYNSNISYGSFVNLKPFYISWPAKKETELCLCSKCLNPHCL